MARRIAWHVLYVVVALAVLCCWTCLVKTETVIARDEAGREVYRSSNVMRLGSEAAERVGGETVV